MTALLVPIRPKGTRPPGETLSSPAIYFISSRRVTNGLYFQSQKSPIWSL